MLHYYGIELQHLNPNEIQHISAFVALCDGYLGIEPNFSLWKYFFTVSFDQRIERKGSQTRQFLARMGCAVIYLRSNQVKEYMPMKTTSSNKGWHQQWFYVKNRVDAPLPEYTGRIIEDALAVWAYGPIEKEKTWIQGLLEAIALLKSRGLTGAGVVGVYHARRVAPMMLRARSLDEMVPGACPEGTVLLTEEIANTELEQHVR